MTYLSLDNPHRILPPTNDPGQLKARPRVLDSFAKIIDRAPQALYTAAWAICGEHASDIRVVFAL